MAAGDIYKASEAQTTASQREALAALARGGTAERDAYLASQQAQQGDQQRIMAEILSRATAIGAPAGAAGEMQAAAQPGFDRRAMALAGAQGSAATALDQITKANSNYFDQVNAAVPLVKARSDEINEANRIKAEQAEADRQLRYQLAQMQLARSGLDFDTAAAKAAADRASAASGGDLSDSELRTRLVGAARAEKASTPPRVASVFGAKVALPKGSDESVARRIGTNAGVPASRVFGLLPDPKVSAPKQVTPKQATHRQGVLDRVVKHASDKTAGLIINITADAGSYADALNLLREETDADLKKAGISRSATERWLRDYYSV